MIKKLDDAIFATDNIIFIDEDSNNITFFSDEMGLLSVDLDKINLGAVNFEMISKILFTSDLWLGVI